MRSQAESENAFRTPVKPENLVDKSLFGERRSDNEFWSTFKKKKWPIDDQNTILLTNRKGFIHFKFYRDADLGISKEHQVMVHPANNDDDYETDEEQIAENKRYCIYQAKLAIKSFLVNKEDIEHFDSDENDDENDEEERTLKKFV